LHILRGLSIGVGNGGHFIMSQSKENVLPSPSLKRNSASQETPSIPVELQQSAKKLKIDDTPAVEEVSDEDEEYKPEVAEGEAAVSPSEESPVETVDNPDYQAFKSQVLGASQSQNDNLPILGEAN